MGRVFLSLTMLAVTGPLALAIDALPIKLGDKSSIRVNEKVTFKPTPGGMVPLDLAFRDESGARVTLRECMVPGKPVVLVLAYYRCPMLCTEVLNGLLDALRTVVPYSAGTDYTVLTVSFDPKEHHQIAADKKKAYLAEYGRPNADKGWRFLTGDKDPIGELTQSVGFNAEYDKTFKEYDHASGIVFLTPEGKISAYFAGIGFNGPDNTGRDFRLALVEASDGKIGTFKDQILYRCYRFDHLNNGYSFDVLTAVRIGGILTVIFLVVMVSFMLVRHRSKPLPPASLQAGPNTGDIDHPMGVAT